MLTSASHGPGGGADEKAAIRVVALETGHLIELFGLPGAGKSTTVNSLTAEGSPLADELSQPEPLKYRVLSRPRRLAMQLRLHRRLLPLAVAAYRMAIFQRRPSAAAARGVPALLVDAERLSHASRQLAPGQWCVFKQGPLQQLRAVIARAGHPNERAVARVLTELQASIRPSADWVVVHLDTSAETATARVGQRPGALGRYDRMTPERRLAELRAERAAQDQIVGLLRRRWIARVERLDGELPPAKLTAQASASFDAMRSADMRLSPARAPLSARDTRA